MRKKLRGVEYDVDACVEFAAVLIKVRSEAYMVTYMSYLMDCRVRMAKRRASLAEVKLYEQGLRELFVDDDRIVYLQEHAEKGITTLPIDKDKKPSRSMAEMAESISVFKKKVVKEAAKGIDVASYYGLRPNIVKRWVREARRNH